MLSVTGYYGFERGKVYNLEASQFISKERDLPALTMTWTVRKWRTRSGRRHSHLIKGHLPSMARAPPGSHGRAFWTPVRFPAILAASFSGLWLAAATVAAAIDEIKSEDFANARTDVFNDALFRRNY